MTKTGEGTNKKLPIKSDEESSLVDYAIELSNFDLVKDLAEIASYLY